MPSPPGPRPSVRRRRLAGPVRLLALAVGLLGVSACAAASPFAEGSRADSQIRIEVRNRNFDDGAVYAIRLGQSMRLGTVMGQQTETFTTSWPTSLPLRVEVRFLGGARCITPELPTDPGDHIYVEIPANIALDPDCVSQ